MVRTLERTAPPARLHLIYNPIAGQRHAALFRGVLSAIASAGGSVTLVETKHQGHAEQLAREVVQQGAQRIAVAGGDGTINEVINGLAKLAEIDRPPVGIIPCGTANVVAREIGVGKKIGTIVDTLLHGLPLPVYPGVANERLFVFCCGIGFDAQAVAMVSPTLKSRIGSGAYLWSALNRMLSRAPDGYQIQADGVAYSANSVVIAKGRHYAGGYIIAPSANLGADRFEVCLFRFPTRAHMALFGAALMAGGAGNLGNGRSVMAKTVTVIGPEGEPVQLDGDIRTALPCDIRVSTTGFRLLTPRHIREDPKQA